MSLYTPSHFLEHTTLAEFAEIGKAAREYIYTLIVVRHAVCCL
jgi:hypothetical protein